MMESVRTFVFGILASLGLASPPSYQGYGEGEYVLISPQIGGQIDDLAVVRGQNVHKGDMLFTLEHGAETAAVNEAQAQVDRADANLADLLKAKRQPELDALLATRDQAAAALHIAEINFERDQKQIKVQAVSQAVVDSDKAALEQARAKLAETNAALETGKLSTGRDDAIHVAQAEIASTKASLAIVQWKLDQKKLVAPADAFVFDTIYRSGEYVKEGQPVVSLLPPTNIKVRFFVSNNALSSLSLGQAVTIKLNNHDEPITAKISYIAPQAEYSPPQLYNRDNREKLLYMLEATPETHPERIHPGQTLDVMVEESEDR
jgi:HlyD family secretion protein